MSRSLIPLILFSLPGTALAQSTDPAGSAEQMIENARKLVAVDADGCLKNYNKDEIVVCGAFDANRQHRLPFPELVESGERIREPIPKGNPEYVTQGRCYVTYTERNCFKGVPLMTVSLGGSGGGIGGPAGRLWRAIKPEIPDDDYVKQAMVKPNSAK